MSDDKKKFWQQPPPPTPPIYFNPTPTTGGMRMDMRMTGGMYDNQVQIQKISPRVRAKPFTKKETGEIFKIKGRKVKND